MEMIWTAWNNGKHHSTGAGYGFKVPIYDRDTHFDPSWKYIKLDLPSDFGTDTVLINVDKPSFWDKTCHELISKEIGQWLIKRELAPWEKNDPPKFKVTSVGKAHFALHDVSGK